MFQNSHVGFKGSWEHDYGRVYLYSPFFNPKAKTVK